MFTVWGNYSVFPAGQDLFKKRSISRTFSLKALDKFSDLIHPSICSDAMQCPGCHITKQTAVQGKDAISMYMMFFSVCLPWSYSPAEIKFSQFK